MDNDFRHVSSDPDFWDEINVKFYRKYHGLDATHQRWIKQAWAGQPIEGPFGRDWLVLPAKNERGEVKLSIPTLTNYPVQGTGADIMSIARVSFANRVRKRNLRCLLTSTVHDSIIVDLEQEDDLDECATIFREVFRDLQANIWRLFKYEWTVPLECEIFYGPNLKDLTEYK